MINDQVKEEIRTHLKDYLEEIGINTSTRFTCLNPSHQDNDPSMSYDDKRNIVHCFSCGTNYDIFNIYGLNNNLTTEGDDFIKMYEDLSLKYNINNEGTTRQNKKSVPVYQRTEIKKKDYTRYINKCKKDIDKSDYLIKRGLSEEIIKKYNIGYDITEHMIVLPISKTCYLGRYTDDTKGFKHHKPKGTTNEIFNGNYLKESDFKTIVWVTESIIDALSLEQVNEDIKAISLNSINNSSQLVREAKDNDYKGIFILAFDTDYNGIKASQELQEDLEAIGIKSVIFNSASDKFNVVSEDGKTEIKNKDINEWLLSDEEKLLKNVTSINDMLLTGLEQKAIDTYQQENVLNYLDVFNQNIQDQEKNKPLSTGIKALDEALEGGFYKKNLVILGAISSIGKTTLALQIGDNIATSGNDVLIFSLEMSKEELIAKSLSRNSFLKASEKNYTALALTTREILKGNGLNQSVANRERANNYSEAYEYYKENIASNIYITECNSDMEININTINDKIKNHIAITNNKPFVIIDYLQIIQNQEKGLTDKQVIDKIVTSLKRIARDNDITILLISAFNRNSYSQESNLASFRDSSTIEYTSDVLLSIQPKIMDGQTEDSKNKQKINQVQQEDERELTLKVLKNRNGRISDVKDIKFYAKYNYMNFKD